MIKAFDTLERNKDTMNREHQNLTLSEIRRVAGLKGVEARRLNKKPNTNPLTTISVRTNDKTRLQAYADEQGITLTEAFHRKV